MENNKNLSHDRLLSECFMWLWNTHPETRYTAFHVTNELKPQKNEAKKQYVIRLSQAKAIGVVAGVTDLIWYWGGKLYVFDVKVGGDKLSDAQKTFISAIEAQGGVGYEIRSFEQFKAVVEAVFLK
jgi:hypothetical protein